MTPFIQTSCGHAVDLINPDLTDVTIDEVAGALARINRFTGHTGYNVACHSIEVSRHVPKALAMWGLLHDAHEAFIGDISNPVKRALELLGGGAALRQLDETMEAAVRKRWGLVGPLPEEVERADLKALATEKRDLFYALSSRNWGISALPWPEPTVILDVYDSERAFLRRFCELQACRDRGECL